MTATSAHTWGVLIATVLPPIALTILLAAVVGAVIRGVMKPRILVAALVLLALGIVNPGTLAGAMTHMLSFFFGVVQSAYAATMP